jgi:drug/metabolite transporter (DMT)-like permease
LATHYIPAAEANLISYLWPVEIIALGAMVRLFRLRFRHMVGLACGFAGTAMLIGGGMLSLSMTGVSLAFISGMKDSGAATVSYSRSWLTQPLFAARSYL